MGSARTGTAKTPVAVFDADSPPTLAFVRSLGRLGVPVHVYSPSRVNVARLSQHAVRFAACPPTDESNVFLPWLRARVKSGEIALVAPTSDSIAFALAEVHEHFGSTWRAVMPSPEDVHACLFKDRFDAACERAGFQTPCAFYPTSLDEGAALAPTLPYPVILKPRSHVTAGWNRGVIVHSPDEFLRNFRAMEGRAAQRAILARHPELCWSFIQEYVPGALENLVSVSGVLGPDGEVLALSAATKTRQWPPQLGVGTRFECRVDEPLLAFGRDLARAVVGRGIFELEFIYDARRKERVAIDLNPRGFGQMSLDIARGNDLPRLWYELVTSGKSEPCAMPRADVVWHHAIPEIVAGATRLALGPARAEALRDLVADARQPHVDIVNDWADPLPSAIHALRMLRHPGGLIRPMLQERAFLRRAR